MELNLAIAVSTSLQTIWISFALEETDDGKTDSVPRSDTISF